MGATDVVGAVNRGNRFRIWIGGVLLAAGLAGHLFSAQAIGGHYIAYRDHIAGFCILTIASGLVILGLGRLFWRGRHDISFLALGATQAIFGLLIYINRFKM